MLKMRYAQIYFKPLKCQSCFLPDFLPPSLCTVKETYAPMTWSVIFVMVPKYFNRVVSAHKDHLSFHACILETIAMDSRYNVLYKYQVAVSKHNPNYKNPILIF